MDRKRKNTVAKLVIVGCAVVAVMLMILFALFAESIESRNNAIASENRFSVTDPLAIGTGIVVQDEPAIFLAEGATVAMIKVKTGLNNHFNVLILHNFFGTKANFEKNFKPGQKIYFYLINAQEVKSPAYANYEPMNVRVGIFLPENLTRLLAEEQGIKILENL